MWQSMQALPKLSFLSKYQKFLGTRVTNFIYIREKSKSFLVPPRKLGSRIWKFGDHTINEVRLEIHLRP